jgi:hypothetical protein
MRAGGPVEQSGRRSSVAAMIETHSNIRSGALSAEHITSYHKFFAHPEWQLYRWNLWHSIDRKWPAADR